VGANSMMGQLAKVEFIDENIDLPYLVGVRHIVRLSGSRALWPRCSPSIKRFIGILQLI